MKIGDRIRVIDEDSMLCGEFGTISGLTKLGLFEIQLEGWTQPDWVVFLHPQCVELSLRAPLWWERQNYMQTIQPVYEPSRED